MTRYVVPIVEGQTEQASVDRLLHRIWLEQLGNPERLQVLEAFRGHRDQLIHPNGLVLTDTIRKAFLQLKAKSRKEADTASLVLILLDAEADCVAELSSHVIKTATLALPPNAKVVCTFAKQMFENWIVGGASTLAGINGLPSAIPVRTNVEHCSGASWLDRQVRAVNQNRSYKKTVDAKEFVKAMDLQEARSNCPSFERLIAKLRDWGQTNQATQEEPPTDIEGTPAPEAAGPAE